MVSLSDNPLLLSQIMAITFRTRDSDCAKSHSILASTFVVIFLKHKASLQAQEVQVYCQQRGIEKFLHLKFQMSHERESHQVRFAGKEDLLSVVLT